MSLQVWLPLRGDLTQQGLGNYRATIMSSPTIVTGKIGNAYRFGNGSASSNGIEINSNLVDLMQDQYSVAVWVCPYGNHYHYNGTIFSSGNWNAKRYAFGLSQDNSQVDILCNGHNTYLTCAVPTNTWTHLACTCDGNNVVRLYKNGEYVGSSTRSDKPTSDNTTISCIGRETYASGYFTFNGALNDFRLYDHCLSQAEIHELAQGLVLHYKLDNNGWGQKNLLKESHVAVSGTSYALHDYYFVSGEAPVNGQTYTIQLKGQLGTGKTYFGIYNSGGSVSPVSLTPSDQKNGIYTKTFTWTVGSSANTYLRVYHMVSSTVATSTIEWIKLEEGAIATPWCPNPTDAAAATMGISDTTVYDCSGFGNNSQLSALPTITSDTPKYVASSTFGAYNTPKTDLLDTSILPALSNCTVTWWEKTAGTATLLLTGHTTSYYVAASNNNTFYHGNAGSPTMYRNGVAGSYQNVSGTWYHYALVGVNLSAWTQMKINSYGSSWPVNGQLCDFRIYATALSADDIKLLYENSAFIDSGGSVHGALLQEV